MSYKKLNYRQAETVFDVMATQLETRDLATTAIFMADMLGVETGSIVPVVIEMLAVIGDTDVKAKAGIEAFEKELSHKFPRDAA